LSCERNNNDYMKLGQWSLSNGMYLSEISPSPPGNKALHFKPVIMTKYFAPQLGQSKLIGSGLLGRQLAGICVSGDQ